MASPITIEAFVPVSPEVAWRAYVEPQAITQWNQASPDWHCPSAEVHLVVGGTHRARMEARDGSMGFDLCAVYEEVNSPSAFTMRLDDDRLVRTTFVAEPGGTRVTTVFDPESTHPVEMQREGWQAILNSYAAFVVRSAV
jgi:uncharacterized protein YndB with AHSA1/START domain